MPATYISKKLPSGNKAFCILARSNDVGIFRDESSGASIAVRVHLIRIHQHFERRTVSNEEKLFSTSAVCCAELREDSHNSSVASPPVSPRPYTFLCSYKEMVEICSAEESQECLGDIWVQSAVLGTVK
ncbi:Uncharacterized protein DBV15_07395, partial [Temnothorax longispinosus]